MPKLHLPPDYGSVETLNLEKLDANKRLGIVVPTFGRSTYVEQCLLSLSKSHLNNCILCFVDESLATPRYQSLRGFTLFPNVESEGMDIGRISPSNPEFERIVLNTERCIAVNSAGWMKHTLNPRPTWMFNSHFCTYVSDDYLKAHPQVSAIYREKVFAVDKKTPELIRNFLHPDIPVIKIFKTVHGNMYDSIRTAFDLLSEFTDTLVVLDSDTIQKNDWLETLYSTFRSLSSTNKGRPIILSGFHTKEHPVLRNTPKYRIKASLGGCNMCMDVDTYQLILRPVLTDVAWDHAIRKRMAKYNGIYAATKPSVVQHIGRSGLWSNVKRFDSSSDFDQGPIGLFTEKISSYINNLLHKHPPDVMGSE